MNKNQITKYAFFNALIAATYIALVATIMNNIEHFIGSNEGGNDSVFAPITFLLLFVISAAVMAITIFGRPVMWYLDGKRKEAVGLVLSTIGFLILFFLALLVIITAITINP